MHDKIILDMKGKSLYEWCVENNRQELLDEWDYERNSITPKDIYCSSNYKAYWKLHYYDEKTKKFFDFKWQSGIYHRIKNNNKCPYLSTPIKLVWPGFNDFVTQCPDVALEWDYDKNGSLKPETLARSSTKRVWWICSQGHSYDMPVSEKTHGNGCPICSGKRVLKGYNDLLSKHPDLAKEWDYNKNSIGPDEITFGADKIKVWWKCNTCGYEWETTPNHRTNRRGTGCPVCANKIVVKGINDLATTHPDIAKNWHPELNGKITPQSVVAGSDNFAYWICKNNSTHVFKQRINSAVYTNNACPICSNYLMVTGINDLATLNPELLDEWNYNKNRIDPTKITTACLEQVWWKCKNCGQEWRTAVATRVRMKTGCPYCAGQKVTSGVNDLATLNPELAKEWDYNRNKIKPSEVMPYSGLKSFWICPKGHSYDMTISDRSGGKNCPICAGKRILLGYNDLASQKPELLKEWNYKKNHITPQEITAGSDKMVWWECKKGHEWRASPVARASGRGCPKCSQELKVSFPERAVLYYMSKCFNDVQSNVHFDWLGKSELDIYIPEIRVAIEYDGGHWHKNVDRDIKKDVKCEFNGITLIRIRDKECPDYKSSSIKIYLEDTRHNIDSLVAPLNKLFSIIKDIKQIQIPPIDLDKDEISIYELWISRDKEKSLTNLLPDVAKQWNYEKNGKITPDLVSFASNKPFWWKCENGHEWKAAPNSRMRNGCPYCSNQKVLAGFNDMATTRPDMLELWDYEKNYPITPQMITAGSNKRVWWKCEKGHSYQSSPSNKSKKKNCPICINAKIYKGYNDLATLSPIVAEEWDYEKNYPLTPFDVGPGSEKKVWFKCKRGHSWRAVISSRKRAGCPECYKLRKKDIDENQMYMPFLDDNED